MLRAESDANSFSFRAVSFQIIILSLWTLVSDLGLAQAAEFRDRLSRDFPLRHIGRLQVTNLRGNIQIKGWTQDRVRVQATRIVQAETEAEAQLKLKAMDFRFEKVEGDIELSAEYGRGLSLEERLRERKGELGRMEITVLAPYKLKLSVWSSDGSIDVEAWRASLEVRTASSRVHLTEIQADQVSVSCPDCEISARKVRASFRCLGGSKQVTLEQVKGKTLYVETQTGPIRAIDVSGEQLYVTGSGALEGRRLFGQVEFSSRSGDVKLEEIRGSVSGKTESSSINAEVTQWIPSDKAFLESRSGLVSLRLPRNFSGEIEARSGTGDAVVALPFFAAIPNPASEPNSRGVRLRGRVGEGGEMLRIESLQNQVRVGQTELFGVGQ